jgi:hypothetical protein
MEAYTQYFGGSQPNLPARAVVQVAGLSNPGWLVEIEVVAAKNNFAAGFSRFLFHSKMGIKYA